jgi:putative membrane protein
MGKFITKTLITSIAALIAAYMLAGVSIDNSLTAILVAAVLGLLNNFVKPVLIILTIPITLVTFGLFLLFINILMIKWVAALVPGFEVSSWWSALWFGIIVSIFTSILEAIFGTNTKEEQQ